MTKTYLKRLTYEDKELNDIYNNDFIQNCPNVRLGMRESNFYGWLDMFAKNEMKVIPFLLIESNNPIGLIIIKIDIEKDEVFKKYGGNISYEIAPSYRGQGYGTLSCHLALKECQNFGLEEVMIACDERNVGSINIIENNYGVLRDVCIDKPHKGSLLRRYIVNINDSLQKYKEKAPKIKPSLKEICNIDRSDLNDFLVNTMQNYVGPATLEFSERVKEIKNIDDIEILYNIFLNEFTLDKENKISKFSRTTEDIIKSKIYTDCNDAGLVLGTILRIKGIPTVYVHSAHTSWISDLQQKNKNAKMIHGHVFLEIYLHDKWYLFDSANGKIYGNYDYYNLSLPNGYYAFRKALNNYNYGAYSFRDNNRIMVKTFEDFNLSNYNDPNYDCLTFNRKNHNSNRM